MPEYNKTSRARGGGDKFILIDLGDTCSSDSEVSLLNNQKLANNSLLKYMDNVRTKVTDRFS